jgi:hypothetical protein
MSDMEPETLGLIEAARGEAGLSPEQHSAGRTRLAKQLGVVAAGAALETVTVGSTAAAAGAAKTTLAVGTLMSKIALGLSVVGVTVAVYAVTREPKRAPSPPNEPAVITNTAPAMQNAPPPVAEPPSPAEPSIEPTSTAPRAVVPGSGASAPSSRSPDIFAGDAKLLRDVHEAVGTGRAEQALAMLDARRAQGVEGAFAQERAAARVVVLCRLGRTADARADAARFLSAYPKSPLGERVRHTCDEPARK